MKEKRARGGDSLLEEKGPQSQRDEKREVGKAAADQTRRGSSSKPL